jgi:predicted RNA-binding Zn ribbon-like protein
MIMKGLSTISKKGAKRLFDLTLTGRLPLDFANTLDWRVSESPRELLNFYEDFVRWGRYTGLLTERQGRDLLKEAGRLPEEARAVVRRAIELRETIYRLLSAVAAGHDAAKADVAYLNKQLRAALANLQIEATPEGFQWGWSGGRVHLERMLWDVAHATADFLIDEVAVGQLRECPGAGCAWLFVDTTRNKKRRWCSMESCGNRAKARRHYEQTRAVQSKGSAPKRQAGG